MTQHALVMFSGGQDSATCLAWALENYSFVETVGFTYHQKHSVELKCRKSVLQKIGSIRSNWSERLADDHVIDLSIISELGESALTRDMEIKMMENGLPSTFVPGRNLFFFLAAGVLMYRRGISVLVAGMCEPDFSGYPDCRDETIKAMQNALNMGLEKPLLIETPLMWIDKSQTWKMAKDLGGQNLVDLIVEETHTCYRGERSEKYDWGYGCDNCPACELRKNGYRKFLGSKE